MKNIYHRYINLPFEITKPPICNLQLKEVKHQDIPYHREIALEIWLEQFNLYVYGCECFFTPGGKALPVHVDAHRLDNHVKINQSWGPPEGTTRWWNVPNFNINDYTNDSFDKDLDPEKSNYYWGGLDEVQQENRSIRVREEDAELVYEANTDKPSLVNVGTFHSSYNPTNQGRWTLCYIIGKRSIQEDIPEKYLSWDEAEVIFKDYLI